VKDVGLNSPCWRPQCAENPRWS